jgi:hypothetical protein
MADVNDINIHRSPLGPYHIYIYDYIQIYAQYRIYVDGNGYLKYMNVKVNGKIGDSEEDSIQTR